MQHDDDTPKLCPDCSVGPTSSVAREEQLATKARELVIDATEAIGRDLAGGEWPRLTAANHAIDSALADLKALGHLRAAAVDAALDDQDDRTARRTERGAILERALLKVAKIATDGGHLALEDRATELLAELGRVSS